MFQEPDEWRLDAQLNAYAQRQKARGMTVTQVDSEHFYTHTERLFPSTFRARKLG